jgi:hypothetical protein
MKLKYAYLEAPQPQCCCANGSLTSGCQQLHFLATTTTDVQDIPSLTALYQLHTSSSKYIPASFESTFRTSPSLSQFSTAKTSPAPQNFQKRSDNLTSGAYFSPGPSAHPKASLFTPLCSAQIEQSSRSAAACRPLATHPSVLSSISLIRAHLANHKHLHITTTLAFTTHHRAAPLASTAMSFGSFEQICKRVPIPLCALVGPYNGAKGSGIGVGIEPQCYSRTIEAANTIIFQAANDFVHIGALIMCLIMVFHVRSKFTAVGRFLLLRLFAEIE